MDPDRARIETAVRTLAAIDRPSASPGEREAAEWIAARLAELGCTPRVEEEPVHGGYWWPIGLLSALAAAGGLLARRGRRGTAATLAAASLAALWDDLDHRGRWFRRLFLRRRPTANVTAEAGDRDAERTVVLVAHHDAAHSGAIYNPALPRVLHRAFPTLYDRVSKSPPLLWLVVGGPLLVLAGALADHRRALTAGTVLSLGTAATMVDIGVRDVVPGANDNLTGVATLLELARLLRDEPLHGLRVVLVSAGAEESNSEGFQAWARRHLRALPRESTRVVCVDTVGSPTLAVPESEGMLRAYGYDDGLKDLASAAARELGIEVRRGLRFSFSSDAQIALHAGYRAILLGSIDALKAPANYHWPSDVPGNIEWDRVLDAVRLCEAMLRQLAAAGHAITARP